MLALPPTVHACAVPSIAPFKLHRCHQVHRNIIAASSQEVKPRRRGYSKHLSPDALELFHAAQSNILELNKSRLQALEELKSAQEKISILESQLMTGIEAKAMQPGQMNSQLSQPPDKTPPYGSVATINITYSSGWPQAYAHYSVDGKDWTKCPGDKLDGTPGNYRLRLQGNSVELAFNDGKNDWDTPGPKKNYMIKKAGNYKIDMGKVTKL